MNLNRIFFLLMLFVLVNITFNASLTAATAVKVITVPENVKAETFQGTFETVANLGDEGIFKIAPTSIRLMDDHFYLAVEKPFGLLKMTLTGKKVATGGGQGEGPGQFMKFASLTPYNGNIAIQDSRMSKLVVYDSNLKFKNEKRFKAFYSIFYPEPKTGKLILSGNVIGDYYFALHSANGDFQKHFGKRDVPAEEGVSHFSWNYVGEIHGLPKEDGFWARFLNRYDLHFYKGYDVAVQINAKPGYFKSMTREHSNRKFIMYMDQGRRVQSSDTHLYYFYWFDGKLICDKFELGSYRLLKRICFETNVEHINHYKDDTFYGIKTADNDENDALLVKFQL